jgi:hypothetical protein
MTVGAHVHRHGVDRGGEIGAVVEVEPPEKVLLGLAAARVLGCHQARYELQQVAAAQQRTSVELRAADRPLRRGDRFPDEVQAATRDNDLLESVTSGPRDCADAVEAIRVPPRIKTTGRIAASIRKNYLTIPLKLIRGPARVGRRP